ncbi:MAG: cyclic peptide export ABC transporter [Verrucomicrobiae bacterium]|nr:cyclic peptide export ABC transporter [Verrucomicrobiae bacterium]
MKRIIQLIAPEARPLAVFVALLAAAGGLLSAALVATGNRAIHAVSNGAESTMLLVAAFFGAGLGKLVCGYFSEVLLTKFCHRTIAEMRTNIVRRVLAVPLRTYENVGSPRVFASLTEDVAAISQALSVLPGMVINLAITVGATGYLLYLSPTAFSILAIGAVLGLALYRIFARTAAQHWSAARSTGDSLHEHYRTFTAGVKELKLHARKRRNFIDDTLGKTAELHASQCVTATRRYTFAHSLSHGIIFLLIGVLLFALPRYGLLEGESLSGYVLTCLFLLGPVSGIIYSIPALVRARIAQDKIAELGIHLQSAVGETSDTSDAGLKPDWQVLRLKNATFTYRGEGSREFSAGPIQLEIPRGEWLFITGANGSGKTTLGKMLAGLYEPDSGTFAMDHCAITGSNRDAYRQHISAVFSDFHLFGDLSVSHVGFNVASARGYIKLLGLTDIVHLTDDGKLSTTTALSTGQRKRLALMAAYIDDRDIMIFDEWAADQDPEFRRIFYEQLLPELHAKGKTLIVITHDDRYFRCAQRLIKIADGQLTTLREMDNVDDDGAKLLHS